MTINVTASGIQMVFNTISQIMTQSRGHEVVEREREEWDGVGSSLPSGSLSRWI